MRAPACATLRRGRRAARHRFGRDRHPPKADISEVYLRECGRGRVVYFPGDLGRTFWEAFDADHAKLLANAVRWAANEDPLVTVTGPGVLVVTVWRQRDSLAIHLVNLTNPMMMKGPMRELLAVGPQQVRLKLPSGIKPRRLHLLTSGHTPRVTESAGALLVTVPSILAHEVLAVDV